jgi:DNA polymerase-4
MELFDQLYNRRVLVRLVGVRFSHLLSGSYQMKLFEDNSEMINLYQRMDKIRNRFGQNAVRRASTLGIRGIGQMSNPFNGQPPVIPAHRRM